MRRLPLLALLLLPMAGCAADKFAAPPSGAVTPAAAAAVRAFADICVRMDWPEVQRRAAGYGFTPVSADRLAAMTDPAMRDRNLRILVRLGQAAPAILFWAERQPVCEIALGGVEAAEVEAEFGRFVDGLATEPTLSVTAVPVRDAGGPMRLRRAVVVAPRALLPSPPRGLSFRVNDDQSGTFRVSLVANLMAGAPAEGGAPGGLAAPVPGPSGTAPAYRPKD